MHFWITCNGCQDVWMAGFHSQHGELVAADSTGEQCTDCGSRDLEIGDEYESAGDGDDDQDEVRFDF